VISHLPNREDIESVDQQMLIPVFHARRLLTLLATEPDAGGTRSAR